MPPFTTSTAHLIDRSVAEYWLDRLSRVSADGKGIVAVLALYEAQEETHKAAHAALRELASQLTGKFSKETLATVLVYEAGRFLHYADEDEAKERLSKLREDLFREATTWEGMFQLQRQAKRLADWRQARPKGRNGGSRSDKPRKAAPHVSLSPTAELRVLSWIEARSPYGDAFVLDGDDAVPGVKDLGRALVHLAAGGLCAIEEPDLCCSTQKGRERLFMLRTGGRKPGRGK